MYVTFCFFYYSYSTNYTNYLLYVTDFRKVKCGVSGNDTIPTATGAKTTGLDISTVPNIHTLVTPATNQSSTAPTCKYMHVLCCCHHSGSTNYT